MSLRSCTCRSSQALTSPTSAFQTVPGNPLRCHYSRRSSPNAITRAELRSTTAASTRSVSSRTPSGFRQNFRWAPSEVKRAVDGESVVTPPRWRALPADSELTTPPTTTALQQRAPPKLDTPLNLKRVIAAGKGRDKRYADKASVNRQLKDKGLLSADWRIALDILETYSYRFPTGDKHYESHVTVPEADIGHVIGRFGDTLRFLQEQSGCLIQVAHKRADDKYFTVRITGTEDGTSKAKELMAATKLGGLGLDGYAAVSCTANVRELDTGISPAHRGPTPSAPNLARTDGLPQKHREGVNRFTKRVRQLSAFPTTCRRNQFLRGKVKSSPERVAKTISRLFSAPQNKPFITTRAINEALKFFITHNLVAHARKLFADSELHYLCMDTTTFNIMLRGAAKAKDLHNFTFLLGLMVKRDVRPDSRTWCAFLSVLDRKEVKSLILEKMEEKRLLSDPEVVREVCRQIMSDMAADWLNALKDPRDLLKHMEERFTAAWYSASAINRFLDELGKRGMMQEAWELLEAVDARGFGPNSVSVNVILAHCLRYRKGDWAVQLFRAADNRWNISPDGVTYKLLFKISWTLRLYNMARVVWRYACIAGAVDFRMYQLVKQSLQCHVTSSRSTIGGGWRMTAGRIVTGMNTSRSSSGSPIPSSTTETAFSQSTEHQDEQIGILKQDLATFGKWESVRPLSAMISEAFAMDQAWSTGKAIRDQSLAWKLQNVIHVPVKPILDGNGDTAGER